MSKLLNKNLLGNSEINTYRHIEIQGDHMEKYIFSNAQIDHACQQVEKALAAYGVERREALRMKLTFEEILLEYQQKFGEDAPFRVRFSNRCSTIRVEIIVVGDAFDPMDKSGQDTDVLRGLLSGLGLAPTWNYKNGKNHIVFLSKKKPLSGTVKMAGSIVLAIATGFLLTLLPVDASARVNDYLLTPVTNAIMGLISAVSGPLIFLSVLGSICAMGNMETMGKIGSKTIKSILLYMLVIGICITVSGSLFYHVEWGNGGASDFLQIMELIYDIIPSNLFEPFVTGNTLQLIFIAIMVGLVMLALSARVSGVFSLVEQFSSIAQTAMAGLSTLLPVLIFFIFTGMISNGKLNTVLQSWKMILVILLLMIVYYVINLLRIAVRKKISPILLFKKACPTFLIALTTASSAASFSQNTKDSIAKLGIDKKLVEFAIPLGQVLFMPGVVTMFFGIEIGFAESCGMTITVPWLVIALITNILLAFAVPPVSGGMVMGFTIAFTQLGIPMEVLGVALAVDAILDFPCTACDISGWQLTMIDVADSLDMLDQEVLHKEET